MKNILFILPWLPYPLKSGGHQAIFNGIKAVVNDFNVFITYNEDATEDSSLKQNNLIKELGGHINIIPYKKEQKKEPTSFVLRSYIAFWNLIENIKRKLGLTKEKFTPSFYQINIQSNRRALFLQDIITKNNINIVQCEMMSCISDVLLLPQNIKKIYVQHEIAYARSMLELQAHGIATEYQDFFIQSKKIEIFLLNHFDSIIALSNHDKDTMEKDGVTIPIYVSPPIITTELRPFSNEKKKKILSFVGPSNHTPNLEGILWFLNKSWKYLKKIDSEYTLQIIGEWDDSCKKNIQQHFPEVYFCGFVSELEKYIKNTIMIVPITIGSGIRMKILEAISLSVPVVSTVIGAQGLPLENAKDCFITDDPIEFANDIIKLRDEKIQEKITIQAQKNIADKYSFFALKESRTFIYNSSTLFSPLNSNCRPQTN